MPALGVNATWGQEQWSTYLIQHLAEQSALLRAGCRFLPVGGRNVHIPRTLLDGTAGWVAELAPIPSDSPTGDELVLTPKKTGNVVSLSRESVEDSPISELDAVGNALTRSVARAVDVAALGSAAATATTPGGLLTASVPTRSTRRQRSLLASPWWSRRRRLWWPFAATSPWISAVKLSSHRTGSWPASRPGSTGAGATFAAPASSRPERRSGHG
jgi:hypothetical protein